MTNMENLDAQLVEKERQQVVYDRAMASLRQQSLDEEGAGLALMFGWDEFGGQTKVGMGAKPVLLFAIYAL